MRTLLILFVVATCGCAPSGCGVPPTDVAPSPTTSLATTKAEPDLRGKPVSLLWTSSGSTAMGALIARIRTHKVDLGAVQPTELTYATLEREGRLLKLFDGVQHVAGNETRVSFVDLLGIHPVLAVEQEAHRDWRFWIVATSPRPRTLIDSRDWDVGRNLRAEDLDGDGCAELVQVSLHYWFFDGFNNLDSPFPEVIFRFDPARQRFVPANAHFPAHVEKRLSELRTSVNRLESPTSEREVHGSLLSAVVGVVLELCYEGHTSEAWAYFDEHYTLRDSADRRLRLRYQIASDPVIRAVTHKAG